MKLWGLFATAVEERENEEIKDKDVGRGGEEFF